MAPPTPRDRGCPYRDADRELLQAFTASCCAPRARPTARAACCAAPRAIPPLVATRRRARCVRRRKGPPKKTTKPHRQRWGAEMDATRLERVTPRPPQPSRARPGEAGVPPPPHAGSRAWHCLGGPGAARIGRAERERPLRAKGEDSNGIWSLWRWYRRISNGGRFFRATEVFFGEASAPRGARAVATPHFLEFLDEGRGGSIPELYCLLTIDSRVCPAAFFRATGSKRLQRR